MSRVPVSSFNSILRNRNLSEEERRFLSKLSEEQRKIVMDDSKYTLVRSAAGGGKTTLLIAKYLYLTRIKGVARERIKYLSFNKRNVDDTKGTMLKECGISMDECDSFANTFHALALMIIKESEGCWPILLEPVYKGFSNNEEVDHDKAAVFLKKFEDDLTRLLQDPSAKKFKKDLCKEVILFKGRRPHKYVTYLCDRNGVPGSCRSSIEKEIFVYLVKHGVDFAYEEIDKENKCRPDFTIYIRDEKKGLTEKIIYEHFAFDSETANNYGKKYIKDKKIKEDIYKNRAYRFFSTTGRDNKGQEKKIDVLGPEILRKLKYRCKKLNIPFKQKRIQLAEKQLNELLNFVVERYKEVRTQIIETGQDVKEVIARLRNEPGYPGFFMSSIFIHLEELYSKCLNDPKLVATDFSDSIKRASQHLKDPKKRERLAAFCYDYVLVDEFQDISKARHDLLLRLKEFYPAMQLLAVGDDWQSIYSFTCSDLSFFKFFPSYWPDAKTMDMSETYRFGDDLFSKATEFVQKDPRLSERSLQSSSDRKTTLSVWEADPDNNKKQWYYIKNELKQYKGKKVVILSRFIKDAHGLKDSFTRQFRGDSVPDCLTIHKAKGLTADIVFVQNCDNYSVPYVKEQRKLSNHDKLLRLIRNDKDGEEGRVERESEERRLFYVALTRAREKVYLLYDKGCKSEFIDELGL